MSQKRAALGALVLVATCAHAQVATDTAAPVAVSPAFVTSPAYLAALVTQHQNIRRQINTAKLKNPINLDEIRLLEHDLAAVEDRIAAMQPEPTTPQPLSQDLAEKNWDIFGDFDPAAKKPAADQNNPQPAAATTTKEQK